MQFIHNCIKKTMAKLFDNKQIIVVLGATGTGKSKLSIELAQKFNGEIISADSMQVYKGLNIITNKVTEDEQQLVKHHLLNYVDPLTSDYHIHDFRNSAIDIIDRLHNEGKIPVIVGGTHYYIESVLYNVLIDAKNKSTGYFNLKWGDTCDNKSDKCIQIKSDDCVKIRSDVEIISDRCVDIKSDDCVKIRSDVEIISDSCVDIKSGDCVQVNQVIPIPDVGLSSNASAETPDTFGRRLSKDSVHSTQSLYAELHRVDPVRAQCLHPNDRRKIYESLKVFQNSGIPYSEHLRRQRSTTGGNELGGGLRYSDVIIFWITCDQDVLDKRLDDRVDEMMQRGLVQELEDFHRQYNKTRLVKTKTSVVSDYPPNKKRKEETISNQCSEECSEVSDNSQNPEYIDPHGLYELGIFQSIGFKEFHNYLILDEDEKRTINGKILFEEGIVKLKQATRRYARKQLKWIKNRFVKTATREVPRMYALDSTVPSMWQQQVFQPAVEVVEAALRGDTPNLAPVPQIKVQEEDAEGRFERHECSVCDRVFIGRRQWTAHLASNKHKKMNSNKKRKSPSNEATTETGGSTQEKCNEC